MPFWPWDLAPRIPLTSPVLQDSTLSAEVHQSAATAKHRCHTALQPPPHRHWTSSVRACPPHHVRRTHQLPLKLIPSTPPHLAGRTATGSRAAAPAWGVGTEPGASAHCATCMGRPSDLATGPDGCGQAMGQKPAQHCATVFCFFFIFF
jgi:hypothetical protein